MKKLRHRKIKVSAWAPPRPRLHTMWCCILLPYSILQQLPCNTPCSYFILRYLCTSELCTRGPSEKNMVLSSNCTFIIPSNMGYLCTYLLAFCPCLLSWVLPNCTRTWAQETGSLRGPAVQGPHQNHRGFSEVRLQVSEGNSRSDTNQCGPPGSSSSMDV